MTAGLPTTEPIGDQTVVIKYGGHAMTSPEARTSFAREVLALRHAGARPGGETHYAVTLVAVAFEGQGRVARSRAVHAALTEEFASGLHALSLTLRAPGEAAS